MGLGPSVSGPTSPYRCHMSNGDGSLVLHEKLSENQSLEKCSEL